MWNEPTATATSQAISPPRSDDPSPDHSSEHCANCGSPVSGHYCSNCGQRAGERRLSLGDIAHELAAEHFGLDSKLGRTVITLLRHPGKLTTEFLAGRRIRYVPPLRLYLSLSVLFFLLSAAKTNVTSSKSGDNILRFQTSGEDAAVLDSAGLAAPRKDKPILDTLHGNAMSLYFKRRLVRRVTFVQTHRKEAVAQVSETFHHELPDALFLLVPGLALALMGLYHGSRRYYTEHLVFAFHFQSFSFAALTIGLLPIPFLNTIVGCAIVVYLFIALRKVYGGSRMKTSAKLIAIATGYGISIVAIMGLVGAVAFLYS